MSYTHLSDKMRQIRKAQRCIGCLVTYPISTTLWYRAYVWEGEFHGEYMCRKCKEVFDNMDKDTLEDGFMEGELGDHWTAEGEEHDYPSNDSRI